MTLDPFRAVDDLTIEFVDSAAGSRKTLTAIDVSLVRAQQGVKTIFAMPTLELIKEMVAFARRHGDVPVIEITSRADEPSHRRLTVSAHLQRHITGEDEDGNDLPGVPRGGHLLFITHEAFLRMGTSWPDETKEFEIIIDETPEVVLTRQPFKLRDSHYVLTSFLQTTQAPTSPMARRTRRRPQDKARDALATLFTERDARLMEQMEKLIHPGANASIGEVEQAERQLIRLREKKATCGKASEPHDLPDLLPSYYHIVPKLADDDPRQGHSDPLSWLKRRVNLSGLDDIYQYLEPVPSWLIQGASCFTDKEAWDRMAGKLDYAPDRGRVTISGFRRPEALKSFSRVTMMSALFRHTMLYDVWEPLGVQFIRSSLVNIEAAKTPLGKRVLKIYYLTDQGWSKRMRDRAGGIEAIFDLIKIACVLNEAETTCVVTNKDDATEDDPRRLRTHFPNSEIMPHNSKGQNRFRIYHQLLHCAALNSYTPDIRWIETALGIDSERQRIARTGQEVYQSLMRLSIREPSSRHDVTLIVMDKDVAEWLPQWFEPADQVEVTEIDSTSVVRRKGKPGRPSIGDRPMTAAERQARRRRRQRDQRHT